MDEKTTRRLFEEEAKKLGVTLGPEHSVNLVVYQGTDEKEARKKIREWLEEQKKLKKERQR